MLRNAADDSPDLLRESQKRTRFVTSLAMLLILAVSLAVRFYRISGQCLFFDELWNIELACGRASTHFQLEPGRLYEASEVPRLTSLAGAAPIWTLPAHMQGVTHPPLYTLLLRLWCDGFGTSDRATRTLSAILSSLAVLVFFDALRIQTSLSIAIWASLIMAVAGAQIELAQDVRPYALLILLGVCAIDALVRIERFSVTRPRVFALAGFIFAMLLTHYFAIVAIAALLFYALIVTRGADRRKLVSAMIAPILLFAFLWLPTILLQSRTLTEPSGDEWIRVTEPHHAWQTLVRLCALPMRLMFEPPLRSYPVVYVVAAIFIIPPMLARKVPQVWLWWLWLGSISLSIAGLEVVRSTRHLEIIRYTILAGPGVYALLPLLSQAAPRSLRYALPAAGVLGCAVALPQVYQAWKADYREIADVVDCHYRAGDVVVFSGSFDSELYGSAVFLGVSHYSRTYPWPVMILRDKPTEQQVEVLAKRSGIWLVSPGELSARHLSPEGRITDEKNLAPMAMVQRIEPRQASSTEPAQ
jgi:hypothetical protein